MSRVTNDGKQWCSGRRVLVLGGLGFIGSNLAARIVSDGGVVTIVDACLPDGGANLFNIRGIRHSIELMIGNSGDLSLMALAVKDQDVIFNLAARTGHAVSMTRPLADTKANCFGPLVTLELCRKYNPSAKIVFASTRQIYGKSLYLPVDERHPTAPTDINGINKMTAENYHILYSRVYGLHTAILRLTNTVGPRMRIKDNVQNFVGYWIGKIITDQSFEVWDGDQLRDISYVDDVIEALIKIAAKDNMDGDIYNVGSGLAVTLRTLAEMLVRECGYGKFVVCSYPADRKRIDIGDYYASTDKLQAEVGWSPQITLQTAIQRTLCYYKQHSRRYL
jgi:UDP-glucose 4-epimerase